MSGLAGLGLEGGGAVTLRLSRRLDDGVQTLGWLEVWVGGAVVFGCATLELPWRGNARRVSCIPPGPGAGDVTYRVALRTSARFGAHLDVIGEEPARSLVLIHAGNSFRDTAGCILVGDAVRDVNGDGVLDVANSRATLARLRAWVPPAGCPLVISGVGERPSSRLRAEARAVARRDVAADGVGGLRARPPARLGGGAGPERVSKPARASMTIRNAAVSAASWAAVVVAAVLARLGWDVPADEVSAVLVGLVGLWTSVRAIVGRVRTRTRIEGLLVLAAVLACGSAEAQSARVPGGVVPCYANVWTTDHGAGTLAGKLADVEALAGRAVRHGAGGGAYTGGGLRGAAHVAAALRARGLTAVLNVNAPWRIEETLSASAVERGGAAWGVFLRDHADVYASAIQVGNEHNLQMRGAYRRAGGGSAGDSASAAVARQAVSLVTSFARGVRSTCPTCAVAAGGIGGVELRGDGRGPFAEQYLAMLAPYVASGLVAPVLDIHVYRGRAAFQPTDAGVLWDEPYADHVAALLARVGWPATTEVRSTETNVDPTGLTEAEAGEALSALLRGLYAVPRMAHVCVYSPWTVNRKWYAPVGSARGDAARAAALSVRRPPWWCRWVPFLCRGRG